MLAWIPFLPFVGFLINGIWYAFFQCNPDAKKAKALVPGVIATGVIFGSFIVALLSFFELQSLPEGARFIEQSLFSWIQAGSLSIDLSLRLDPLSSLFTLVITGVGALIHLYSIGYMEHDEAPGKFFSYLNLFCFSMLMLVMGSSLLVLFLGWEGVGLCSYLLIGFWYKDLANASAGKKAFIVNRIGDFGFLLGIFLIFAQFGTLDFSQINSLLDQPDFMANMDPITITLICLFLFIGCTGKSAQIPLYVWLPDAMAGPTPVSALIHAATMVTSGIYMIARLNKLFSASPTAMMVVAVIGCLTAFFAATIAIAQKDIKKVLAYSTVSQLGYMFLACGVGAYVAGVFHVITHAFFKALLFLGAGSVIHGMHGEQDMMKMGGLKTKMPKTYLTMVAAWIAICGIPPFSGFFSKDEILWNAFANVHGAKALWFLGLVTAMLTAFYMTRMFYLTFMGKPRYDEKHPPHESPGTMVFPLMILAVLSVVGGLINFPHMNWLAQWLSPVIPPHTEGSFTVAVHWEYVLMIVSAAVATLSMAFAWKLYRNPERAEKNKKKHAKVHQLLEDKWYVDEIYDAAFVTPIYEASIKLWKGFDVAVIDRIVLGFGRVSYWTGQASRMIQTGSVQVYALVLIIGMIFSVGYLIYGMV